jgi:hypothetical protein
VIVEEKNVVNVSYEKDGASKETLPRFSNYKEIKDVSDMGNIVEYPTNEKKVNTQPNYFLISTVLIAALLIVFYIVAHRKKG